MSDFLKKWDSAFDKKIFRDRQNSTPAAHGVNDPNASHYLKGELFNKDEIAVLLSGKEDIIPAGNTSQYFRGDKTWQLLNTSTVPEATNLYFTQERVRLSLSAQNPISFNTSTGVFTFNYNTTNLKLTSNQLNTIQDIATTSTPTFSGLNINSSYTDAYSGNYAAAFDGAYIVIGDRISNKTFSNGLGIKFHHSTVQHLSLLYQPSSSKFYIGTSSSTSGLQIDTNRYALTIDVQNNRVGINNKTSPSASLDVNGEIWASGIIKESNATLQSRYVAKYYIVDSMNPWPMNAYLHYIEHNRFLGRSSLIKVYLNGSTITTPTQFFDGNFETAFSCGTAGGSDQVLLIDFVENGLTGSNGFTYSSGYFYIQFYPGKHPTSITARTCNRDGVWQNLTVTPLFYYGGAYISYQLSGMQYNYVTKLEITMTPNSTQSIGITEIMYIGTRMTLEEGGMLTKAGGKVFGNLYITDSSSVNKIYLSPQGKILFDSTDCSIINTNNSPLKLGVNNTEVLRIVSGAVGIANTNPTYTLDVSGTGRFTQALRTDNIINQAGTSGTNIFAANINQQGNKSIYNNFISGWTGSGWQIDYGVTYPSFSNLEIDHLTVRRSMRIYELIINQIRGTNGSLFVSSAAKIKSASENTDQNWEIEFEDPENQNLCPFLQGDILLIQRVKLDNQTIVKTVVLQVIGVSGKSITASIISSYPFGAIPEKNDAAVRIGNTTNTNRQGALYLTSDDSNAPYMDVVDGINSWSAWGDTNKLKIRIGNLSGITDSFFGNLNNKYGLYAKGDAYLRGKIYAEAGGWIAGWNINSSELTSPLVDPTGSGEESQIQLIADSGIQTIGLYLNYDVYAVNSPWYLSFGRIKDGNGDITNDTGIAFKQANSTLFELSNSSLQIAGWNFDSQKLYKGYIELNSATSTIGVNSNKVKLFYTNTSNWGLEGRDSSNNLLFQLGSTNKICGWNFDSTKFSSGTVSLEASSTMKGLVVDTDTIKIGSFTYTPLSNTYSNTTTYLLNGYSGISSSDGWWASYNQVLHTQSSASQIYLSTVSNTLYHYVNQDSQTRTTDIDELRYGTIHRLFTETERVLNRKIKIEFKLRGIKYQTGIYHDLFGTVNIIYFNSGWGIIKREQILYFQFLESQVPGVGYSNASVIDKTGANAIEIFVPGNIPDTQYVYIEFTAGFTKGGQYKRALDFEVSDLKFYGYEGCKTHINQEGITIYNSDQNYLSFRKNSFEINAYDIKIANYPVMRFIGKYSYAPQNSVKLADFYINTSDGKVYICSGFNSSTPQWTALN